MTNVEQNFQVVIYWSMIIFCDNPTVMRICHWPVNENSKCLLTNCQEPRQDIGPGGKMSFCRYRGGPSDTHGGPLGPPLFGLYPNGLLTFGLSLIGLQAIWTTPNWTTYDVWTTP